MLNEILQPDDTEERCGLVLKDGRAVEITNVAEDRTKAYEMDAAEVLPYVKADQVVGTWHTHPDSDPNLSGEDREGFLAWPDLEHSVIGRQNGEVVVTTYRIDRGLVVICD